jgi:hypothetical protein
MSVINVLFHVLAFEDSTNTNNPSLRQVDWKRSLQTIPVSNPNVDPKTIQPLVEEPIFDTTVTTTVDNTTTFDLTLSALDPTTYRITYAAGTLPGFRTNRNPTVSGGTITVITYPNNLVTFAHSGTPFGSVVVGDVVFIPGVTTGDSVSPFNPLNEGYWAVLAATSGMLTLARASGEFSGVSEGPITIASNLQFQVFSANGVQVGDVVDISGGFSFPVRKSYQIQSVTPTRIEIQSTVPLANELGISPGIANFKIYKASKKFLYIEADQEVIVRLNGDAGSSVGISPLAPADPSLRGSFFKIGNVWKLAIYNKSTVPVRVMIISAE